MINLFEYRNKVSYDRKGINVDELETYLEEIWNNRERSDYFRNDSNEDEDEDGDKIEEQRFLQVLRKSKHLKSNKYVGAIHIEGYKINLLPKIFYSGDNQSPNEVKSIQLHVLWWLGYCSKITFPTFDSNLSSVDSDFFEILIYLFSKYTRELLSSSIYQQYQEVDKELSYVKGRINTNRHINENLSRGRWHKITCTYDSFEIDNTFNRLVKYVATLLISVSKNQDNQKYLRKILFILDEVSDQVMTSIDCANLKFNPMFLDFEKVRDYCQLFLDHSISFDYKKDLKLFAFLLPMEVVFEDFISGFIKRELPKVSLKQQSTEGYLAKLGKVDYFKLKPDLLFEMNKVKTIGDTKYKILDSSSSKSKYGISQSDMYQMVSYAVRLGIPRVLLIYPQPIGAGEPIFDMFIINDQFSNTDIEVTIMEVGVIDKYLSFQGYLKDMFDNLRVQLLSQFENVFQIQNNDICN